MIERLTYTSKEYNLLLCIHYITFVSGMNFIQDYAKHTRE